MESNAFRGVSVYIYSYYLERETGIENQRLYRLTPNHLFIHPIIASMADLRGTQAMNEFVVASSSPRRRIDIRLNLSDYNSSCIVGNKLEKVLNNNNKDLRFQFRLRIGSAPRIRNIQRNVLLPSLVTFAQFL